VRRALAVAALSLLACAAHQSAPAPAPASAPAPALAPAPAAPPAPPPAPPASAPPTATTNAPTADAAPAAATDDRLAALERCKQGYAEVDLTSRAAAADLARACADLFREPACAAAMRNPPDDPATLAATIANACRGAYCRRLPAPRPRLCDARELPPPSELLPQWGELNQRIMAYELGVAPEALAPLFRIRKVEVPRPLPAAAPAAAAVHVFAKPAGRGRMRVWIDGGKAIDVGDDGRDRDALEGLARAARAKAAPDVHAIFSFDKSLSYGAAIAIIDAFKKQGFSRFALNLDLERD
jgi:biopolymer transport protein ExbD